MKESKNQLSSFINKSVVKIAGAIHGKSRINYFKKAPKAFEIVMDMERYVRKIDFEPKFKELIKLLASKINGCKYCIDLHTKGAIKHKANEEELKQLLHWRDTDIFTSKEKIAFELTEHLTLVSEHGVPDELYTRVREHFNEEEYVNLVLIINQINTWNRISIAMGNEIK